MSPPAAPFRQPAAMSTRLLLRSASRPTSYEVRRCQFGNDTPFLQFAGNLERELGAPFRPRSQVIACWMPVAFLGIALLSEPAL
jgi:hypothetical protein